MAKKLRLAHFVKGRDNIVRTDGSRTEPGKTLLQKQGDNIIRAEEFGSRFFREAEKNFSVGDLELLAVV